MLLNSLSVNLNSNIHINNNKNEKEIEKKREKYKFVKKIYDERNLYMKKKKKINEKIEMLKFEFEEASEPQKNIIKEKINKLKKEIEKIEKEIEGINIQIKYSINDDTQRYNLFSLRRFNQNIDEKIIFETKIKKWISQNKKYENERKKRIKDFELKEKHIFETEEKEKEERKKIKIEELKNFRLKQQNLKKKLHLVTSTKLIKDLPNIPIPKEKDYYYSKSEKKYITNERNLIFKTLNLRKIKMKPIERKSIEAFSFKIDSIIKENIKKNIEKSKKLIKKWKINKNQLPKRNKKKKNSNEEIILSKSTIANNRKDYGNEIYVKKQPKINENLKEETLNTVFKNDNTKNLIKSYEKKHRNNTESKYINIDNSNLNWKLKLYDDDFDVTYQQYLKLKRERLKNFFLMNNKLSPSTKSGRNSNNIIYTNYLTEKPVKRKIKIKKKEKETVEKKKNEIEELYIKNEIINSQIKEKQEKIKIGTFDNNQKTMKEIGKLIINSIYNNLLIMDK